MFDTDLSIEYATVQRLGVSARACYDAGVRGALCEEDVRTTLRQRGESFDWASTETPEAA